MKHFGAFKRVRDNQIQNLAETKFVDILPSETNLVNLVHTVPMVAMLADKQQRYPGLAMA